MPRTPKGRYVLDTFAIFTYLKDEPGAEEVGKLLRNGKRGRVELLVSWVSVTEVFYQTLRRDGLEAAHAVAATIKRWPVKLLPIGDKEALAAGWFKGKFRLSLGDAIVLGTAKVHSAKVMTGDPEFEPVEEAGAIEVKWLSMKQKSQ